MKQNTTTTRKKETVTPILKGMQKGVFLNCQVPPEYRQYRRDKETRQKVRDKSLGKTKGQNNRTSPLIQGLVPCPFAGKKPSQARKPREQKGKACSFSCVSWIGVLVSCKKGFMRLR